jgi:hypothetical protein
MVVREKRKKIWIDRFQTQLFIRIAAYCILYQVAVWLLLSLWEYTSNAFQMISGDSILSNSLVRGLLVLLALAPVLTLDAVKFAHRLVGPLYRFRVTVRAIANDEPVDLVRLRKGDFLLDFRDDFNEMLKTLEAKGFVLVKKPTATPAPQLATVGAAEACPDR